jgi:predicted nucleic acid-binding protein
MTFLLDVNVLLALAHAAHPAHERAEKWFSSQGQSVRFATCSITEIGFLRVSLNARLKSDIATAQIALAGILAAPAFPACPTTSAETPFLHTLKNPQTLPMVTCSPSQPDTAQYSPPLTPGSPARS